MDKKGYSTGFSWVFGLVSMFGIGLLYIVFNQVFRAHLVPVMKDQANSTMIVLDNATRDTIIGNIDKYMTFWDYMPIILFGVIVAYMFIAAIRKEKESQF